MLEIILIYTIVESAEQAEALARPLIEEKLVACANIYPAVRSLYYWEGQLTQSHEVVVTFKTQEALWERVRDHIAANHPYECPAILAFPVQAVNKPYLDWLYGETAVL